MTAQLQGFISWPSSSYLRVLLGRNTGELNQLFGSYKEFLSFHATDLFIGKLVDRVKRVDLTILPSSSSFIMFGNFTQIWKNTKESFPIASGRRLPVTYPSF